MKTIHDHYLIEAWQKFSKENGGCVQCQNPWYDGMCECEIVTIDENFPCSFNSRFSDLITQIEILARELNQEGWQIS